MTVVTVSVNNRVIYSIKYLSYSFVPCIVYEMFTIDNTQTEGSLMNDCFRFEVKRMTDHGNIKVVNFLSIGSQSLRR